VKRGGFSGKNVVNEDPDRKIPLQNMLNRIKEVLDNGQPIRNTPQVLWKKHPRKSTTNTSRP
jgi:hypothetical protein